MSTLVRLPSKPKHTVIRLAAFIEDYFQSSVGLTVLCSFLKLSVMQSKLCNKTNKAKENSHPRRRGVMLNRVKSANYSVTDLT